MPLAPWGAAPPVIPPPARDMATKPQPPCAVDSPPTESALGGTTGLVAVTGISIRAFRTACTDAKQPHHAFSDITGTAVWANG